MQEGEEMKLIAILRLIQNPPYKVNFEISIITDTYARIHFLNSLGILEVQCYEMTKSIKKELINLQTLATHSIFGQL